MTTAIPFKPMLCSPQEERYLDSFNDDWTAEVKYDGERIIAERRDGNIYLWTRREREVSFQFPEIVKALDEVMPKKIDWIIDGEMTTKGGFEKILKRNTKDTIAIKVLSRDAPATLNVFDVLKANEFLCVNNATLAERREILESLFESTERITHAHSVKGTKARHLFNIVTGKDGEGVVLKRLDSKYQPGFRSPYWFKIKKLETADVEVIGATKSDAFPFGALVLAKDGKYYGKVGTGFKLKQRSEILAKIRANPDKKDFARWQVPPDVKREMEQICAPLQAEIKMLEQCAAGKPRHPVWVRWRE